MRDARGKTQDSEVLITFFFSVQCFSTGRARLLESKHFGARELRVKPARFHRREAKRSLTSGRVGRSAALG